MLYKLNSKFRFSFNYILQFSKFLLHKPQLKYCWSLYSWFEINSWPASVPIIFSSTFWEEKKLVFFYTDLSNKNLRQSEFLKKDQFFPPDSFHNDYYAPGVIGNVFTDPFNKMNVSAMRFSLSKQRSSIIKFILFLLYTRLSRIWSESK